MVAASAKAATKPKAGCRCSNTLAVMNTASVLAGTSVASALTRRNSAARAASPGASNENVPETVMAAFRADEVIHRCCAHGRHHRLRHRSEEHTSELQSHLNLVCRLLLEKKKDNAQPDCRESTHDHTRATSNCRAVTYMPPTTRRPHACPTETTSSCRPPLQTAEPRCRAR